MRTLKRLSALLFSVVLLLSLLGGAQTVFATGGAIDDDFDVDVPILPTKTLQRISIQTLPAKCVYLKGEKLNIIGLVVKTIYSDNSTGIANNNQLSVSGYNANVLGEQTVTVTYSGKTATFTVTVYAPGDANGDGNLNGEDATLLLQHAAGWNVTLHTLSADANGDGKIDGADATLMLQYAAGWNVKLGK